MPRRLARVPHLWIVLAFVACGGGDGGEDQPDAREADAAADDAAPDGGGEGFEGYVNLTAQDVEGQPFWGYGIYFMAPTPGGAACYWGEPRGTCCLGLGPVEIPDHESAGTLTLRNETTAMSGDIPWVASESDYGYLSPAFPWSPGDSLRVSAEGDEVPAFTARTVFPAPLEGVEADTGLSLSSDWTVEWSPAGASRVLVTLIAGSHTLACRAPDEDGELTIPATLLDEAFDEGDGTAILARLSVGAAEENPAISLEAELSLSSAVTFEP